MRFVLYIIVIFVVCGCSNSVVVKETSPSSSIVNNSTAATLDIVARPGWRIEIPHTWKNKKVLNGYAATSTEDPPMIVSINSQSLPDDMKNNEFGATALLANLMIDNVKVINSMPYNIAGHPGIAMLIKVDDRLILLQYIVGAYRRGYVASCGAIDRQDIVPNCKSILDTFTPIE